MVMDTVPRPLRVLFRVAAGPRVGFGHLVRAVSLADALGVPARLSVRGSHASTTRTARTLGASLIPDRNPAAVMARVRPDILVLDDRVARETASWRNAARRRGIPVVGIHDLGIGLSSADLVVDGSIGAASSLDGVPALLGTRYAILNPRTVRRRVPAVDRGSATDVVIALGGGPRRAVAVALACAVADRRPRTRIAIAGGFVAKTAPSIPGRAVRWVSPTHFGEVLAGARVAVVAGGVTLYECLALGVAAVAVSVVASQRPTVAAFASRGAAVNGGATGGRVRSSRALASLAATVVDLLDDVKRRRALRKQGHRHVDGRGAARVAAVIGRVARAAAAGKAGER
jgi:UDP-2,4-diacetamido-2,4,6-trideoxy-beta-L-altropyranose hydrolase